MNDTNEMILVMAGAITLVTIIKFLPSLFGYG
jgi:hypothetical protein